MQRREFITLIGGTAVTWPIAARAQRPAMPVIGFLSSFSETQSARPIAEFRRGLNDNGLTEGQGVTFEFRFADGRYTLFSLSQPTLSAFTCAAVSGPIWSIVQRSPDPSAMVHQSSGERSG